MVGRYLMVVALVVGVAIGLLASAGHAESVAARCWLAIPPFIVLIPLLVRQLGAWAVLVTVVFMLLWVLRGPSRSPASVTVAAGAGSILAVQVALFFIRYYRGRQTDLMPLFLVTATAVLSVVIYLGSSDPKYWQRVPVIRQSMKAVVLVSALIVVVVFSSGRSLPITLPAKDFQGVGLPVVIIVLDTVRADHLELYGYHRRTMPGLTEFARQEGVVVE